MKVFAKLIPEKALMSGIYIKKSYSIIRLNKKIQLMIRRQATQIKNGLKMQTDASPKKIPNDQEACKKMLKVISDQGNTN